MNLKEKLQKQTAKSTSYFKPEVGKNHLKIIPGRGETPWIYFKQHYINGKYSVCPGPECELCAQGWAEYNNNGKKMNEEAKRLLSSPKAALLVKLNDDTVKTWVISTMMLDQLIDLDEALFEKDGPELIVTRSGSGIQTRYSFAVGGKKNVTVSDDDLDEFEKTLMESIKED